MPSCLHAHPSRPDVAQSVTNQAMYLGLIAGKSACNRNGSAVRKCRRMADPVCLPLRVLLDRMADHRLERKSFSSLQTLSKDCDLPTHLCEGLTGGIDGRDCGQFFTKKRPRPKHTQLALWARQIPVAEKLGDNFWRATVATYYGVRNPLRLWLETRDRESFGGDGCSTTH